MMIVYIHIYSTVGVYLICMDLDCLISHGLKFLQLRGSVGVDLWLFGVHEVYVIVNFQQLVTC